MRKIILLLILFSSASASAQPCDCEMNERNPCYKKPFVFISYARCSSGEVSEFENIFKENSIRFWTYLTSCEDGSIVNYKNLQQVIPRASVVLVFLSQGSRASQVCKWEFEEIKRISPTQNNMQAIRSSEVLALVEKILYKPKAHAKYLIVY